MRSSIQDPLARHCLGLAALLAAIYGLLLTFGSPWVLKLTGSPEPLVRVLPDSGIVSLSAALGLLLVRAGGPQRQLPLFVVVGGGMLGICLHKWLVIATLPDSARESWVWLLATAGAHTLALALVAVAFYRLRRQIVSAS